MQHIKPTILWQAHEGALSGANIAMLEYITALNDCFSFHVIVPSEGTMIDALNKQGIKYSIVKQYNWTISIKDIGLYKKSKIAIRSLKAIYQTIRIIKQLKPLYVFTNTQTPFAAGIASMICNKPHVWWIHEFGEEDFGFSIGFGNKVKAYKQIQRSSKLVICNSHAVAEKFIPLLPKTTVKYLYQPVSWNKQEEVVNKKEAKYLMFGQINTGKGHLEVLKAIAKLPGANQDKLYIIGPLVDAEYLAMLNEYISANKLEHKVLIETGFFKKEAIFPKFECLIVASRAEAFGRVIVEAQKAGIKAIVKYSGGAPELINSTNGYLYNNENELIDLMLNADLTNGTEILSNYEETSEIRKLKNWLNGYA